MFTTSEADDTICCLLRSLAYIVRSIQILNSIQIVFRKVAFHAALDIVPFYFNIIVPIGTGVFVPEAGDVHQFVNDNPHRFARFTQRYGLAAADSTHMAVTPAILKYGIREQRSSE